MKSRTDSQSRDVWWREWREADFTWSGLKRRRLNGWSVRTTGKLIKTENAPKNARQATLQDLWRSEEDRLVVDESGQVWTVVHAPPFCRNGTGLKSEWSADELARINQAIDDAAARLPKDAFAAPPPLPINKRRPLRMSSFAREWALPIDGAVFGRLPPTLRGHPVLKGSRVAFIADVALSGSCPSLNLRWPLFERNVSMFQMESEDVRFSRAVYLRNLSLIANKVQRTSMVGAHVFGEFEVSSINSNDELLLGNMRCHGDLSFDSTTIGRLSMRGIVVDGDLTISALTLPQLALSDGIVGGRVEFENVNVRQLTIDRFRVDGEAHFTEVDVEKGLKGNNAVFKQSLRFEGLRTALLDFSDAVFNERAEFRGVEIGGGVNFARAHFAKAAYFTGARFGQAADDLLDAFQETRFDSFVDFRGVGLVNFAAFDGANFKSDVRFDNAVFVKDAGINAAIALATDGDRLTGLEHGLRALKQAAEAVRDRNGEQTFYRYELMARRRRQDVSKDERFLSRIYSLISRYGSSFTRPVWAALFIWASFAALYLLLGYASGAQNLAGWAWSGKGLHPAVLDALNLSARSMFNLFGVWSVRPPEDLAAAGFELELLYGQPAAGLIARCLSSLQSVLAGILLFLTALAARRRFQIS